MRESRLYVTLGSFNKFNSNCSVFLKPCSFLRYFLNISSFSISSFLFLLISRYFSSISIPRNFLSNKFAAIPVVLLPANGSKIQAFCFVDARIILVSTESGFCVGCAYSGSKEPGVRYKLSHPSGAESQSIPEREPALN